MRKYFIYGNLLNKDKIYVNKSGLIVSLFEYAAKFDTEEEAKAHLERFKYELDSFKDWRIDSVIIDSIK